MAFFATDCDFLWEKALLRALRGLDGMGPAPTWGEDETEEEVSDEDHD